MRTPTEIYRIRLKTVDRVLETYIKAKVDLQHPLSAFQYDESKRTVNRFLLCEYTVDIDNAIRTASLDDEERRTLVRLLIEQMADVKRVPERYRQPVVNKLGRVFVQRRLDPMFRFKWVKKKIDWRKQLLNGVS